MCVWRWVLEKASILVVAKANNAVAMAMGKSMLMRGAKGAVGSGRSRRFFVWSLRGTRCRTNVGHFESKMFHYQMIITRNKNLPTTLN